MSRLCLATVLLCLSAGRSGGDTLDWAWSITTEQFYDSVSVARVFTPEAKTRLRTRLGDAFSPEELATGLNPLLEALHMSHTHLFTRSDMEYWLQRSMFRPAAPPTGHLGVQWKTVPEGCIVTHIWDGGPGRAAGLRRGDVILTGHGTGFRSPVSFAEGTPVLLRVKRGQRIRVVRITPVVESVNRSLERAVRSSVRRWTRGRVTVGYVHLWSCTSQDIAAAFRDVVRDSLAGASGILLDLRGGYGGGWLEYLDPFFPDRSGWGPFDVVHRGRTETVEPVSAPAHPWFSGPVVALIDAGTRSGKEAVAFQLRRSGRASLVGTTTAGAFAAGAAFFSPDDGCVLYLAVNAVRVGGEVLEGRGVSPDETVPYRLDGRASGDPQLDRALEILWDRVGP